MAADAEVGRVSALTLSELSTSANPTVNTGSNMASASNSATNAKNGSAPAWGAQQANQRQREAIAGLEAENTEKEKRLAASKEGLEDAARKIKSLERQVEETHEVCAHE